MGGEAMKPLTRRENTVLRAVERGVPVSWIAAVIDVTESRIRQNLQIARMKTAYFKTLNDKMYYEWDGTP